MRATALRSLRLHNSRGGHALRVRGPVIRIFKGVGTKNRGALSPGHHDHVMLAPPAAPTDTAGTQMPVFGSGRPVLAAAPLATASNATSPRDMRILLIAADGNETDFGAIKADLDSVGIPYTVLIATQTPLTDAMLWDGVGRGYYQGVIMTTNSLTYSPDGGATWLSAFTDAEFQTLWAYEASFGVRQVTSYTAAFGWPETLGLSFPVATVDTTSTPLTATLTTTGRACSPTSTRPSTCRSGTPGSTSPRSPDPATTTPLIVANGYPIASVHVSADGRENLAVTAANAYYLRHSQVLGYGVVNWVTKGLFLGKKRISMTPQVDDLFIDNDQWVPSAHSDTTGLIYRNTATDWQAPSTGRTSVRASSPPCQPSASSSRSTARARRASTAPDTLTNYVYTHMSTFSFVSHTWSHQNLDYANNESGTLTSAKRSTTRSSRTTCSPASSKFPNYYKDAMVQPDISGLNTLPSGLNNNLAQQTVYDLGIRYMISDTSRPGWNNPSPNVGFYASGAPNLLIIPRHPTNIFYNVSTPTQVVDEYNFYYAPGGAWAFWPSPRTYDQIIDTESDDLLAYMVQGDNDPSMFHISNFRAYDGVHSVLGDLLTATFNKYRGALQPPHPGQQPASTRPEHDPVDGLQGVWRPGHADPVRSITLTASNAAASPSPASPSAPAATRTAGSARPTSPSPPVCPPPSPCRPRVAETADWASCARGRARFASVAFRPG